MLVQLELTMANESGQKRGRPVTTGETGIFRVARDLYLMINWIADAKRITQTQVAERYLRYQIMKTFLQFRNDIKQRKVAEDEKAKEEGTTPLPLPRIKVYLPLPLRQSDVHEFHPELDHTGPDWEWADQMSDERLRSALNYEGSFEDREHWDDYVTFEAVLEEPATPVASSAPAPSSPTKPPPAPVTPPTPEPNTPKKKPKPKPKPKK